MAPPEPLPAPGKIAHHGYEYGDCALLICVSPQQRSGNGKKRDDRHAHHCLSPCRFLLPFILSLLLKRRNECPARTLGPLITAAAATGTTSRAASRPPWASSTSAPSMWAAPRISPPSSCARSHGRDGFDLSDGPADRAPTDRNAGDGRAPDNTPTWPAPARSGHKGCFAFP